MKSTTRCVDCKKYTKSSIAKRCSACGILFHRRKSDGGLLRHEKIIKEAEK